jgi:hypothetical protein
MQPKVGELVAVAGIEWVVLDKDEDSVLCLTRDCVYKNENFDERHNNYGKSDVRHKLNGFLRQITDAVGYDSVCDAMIDLTSEDGLDDYGVTIEKIGLLSANAYRRYNRIIEKHQVNSWWWLATPASTEYRHCDDVVVCVERDGQIHHECIFYELGVRPFCIFKSSIFAERE